MWTRVTARSPYFLIFFLLIFNIVFLEMTTVQSLRFLLPNTVPKKILGTAGSQGMAPVYIRDQKVLYSSYHKKQTHPGVHRNKPVQTDNTAHGENPSPTFLEIHNLSSEAIKKNHANMSESIKVINHRDQTLQTSNAGNTAVAGFKVNSAIASLRPKRYEVLKESTTSSNPEIYVFSAKELYELILGYLFAFFRYIYLTLGMRAKYHFMQTDQGILGDEKQNVTKIAAMKERPNFEKINQYAYFNSKHFSHKVKNEKVKHKFLSIKPDTISMTKDTKDSSLILNRASPFKMKSKLSNSLESERNKKQQIISKLLILKQNHATYKSIIKDKSEKGYDNFSGGGIQIQDAIKKHVLKHSTEKRARGKHESEEKDNSNINHNISLSKHHRKINIWSRFIKKILSLEMGSKQTKPYAEKRIEIKENQKIDNSTLNVQSMRQILSFRDTTDIKRKQKLSYPIILQREHNKKDSEGVKRMIKPEKRIEDDGFVIHLLKKEDNPPEEILTRREKDAQTNTSVYSSITKKQINISHDRGWRKYIHSLRKKKGRKNNAGQQKNRLEIKKKLIDSLVDIRARQQPIVMHGQQKSISNLNLSLTPLTVQLHRSYIPINGQNKAKNHIRTKLERRGKFTLWHLLKKIPNDKENALLLKKIGNGLELVQTEEKPSVLLGIKANCQIIKESDSKGQRHFQTTTLPSLQVLFHKKIVHKPLLEERKKNPGLNPIYTDLLKGTLSNPNWKESRTHFLTKDRNESHLIEKNEKLKETDLHMRKLQNSKKVYKLVKSKHGNNKVRNKRDLPVFPQRHRILIRLHVKEKNPSYLNSNGTKSKMPLKRAISPKLKFHHLIPYNSMNNHRIGRQHKHIYQNFPEVNYQHNFYKQKPVIGKSIYDYETKTADLKTNFHTPRNPWQVRQRFDRRISEPAFSKNFLMIPYSINLYNRDKSLFKKALTNQIHTVRRHPGLSMAKTGMWQSLYQRVPHAHRNTFKEYSYTKNSPKRHYPQIYRLPSQLVPLNQGYYMRLRQGHLFEPRFPHRIGQRTVTGSAQMRSLVIPQELDLDDICLWCGADRPAYISNSRQGIARRTAIQPAPVLPVLGRRGISPSMLGKEEPKSTLDRSLLSTSKAPTGFITNTSLMIDGLTTPSSVASFLSKTNLLTSTTTTPTNESMIDQSIDKDENNTQSVETKEKQKRCPYDWPLCSLVPIYSWGTLIPGANVSDKMFLHPIQTQDGWTKGVKWRGVIPFVPLVIPATTTSSPRYKIKDHLIEIGNIVAKSSIKLNSKQKVLSGQNRTVYTGRCGQ